MRRKRNVRRQRVAAVAFGALLVASAVQGVGAAPAASVNPEGCTVVAAYQDEPSLVLACPDGRVLSRGPEEALFHAWQGCVVVAWVPSTQGPTFTRVMDAETCYR